MSGAEFHGDRLVVHREPNELDLLATRFSEILSTVGISHVFISGYVAILTGRARGTEDIDVLIERVTDRKIEQLVSKLKNGGLWGPAMPLDSMSELLEDNIWIAPEGEMIPHIELKFATDEYDRASLQNSIVAELRAIDIDVPVGPLELQVAYKLHLGTQKDFEDAVHLHSLFEENLSTVELERWVETLGVEDMYDRLR